MRYNRVFVYTHQGAGDAIIANGMIRTIAKKWDRIYLFCKPRNFKNVAFMFRDLSNIKFISMEDSEIRSFISLNPNNNYIIAGHDKFWKILNNPSNTLRIDEIFYQLAEVPFENKWKEFYLQRNIEREKEVFSLLSLKEGDVYAFLHDSDNRRITKSIPKIRIIKPTNKEFSIFDFLYTIEKAKEVHCINSSFYCLIDCMRLREEGLFLHEYAREEGGEKFTGIISCNWKVLK